MAIERGKSSHRRLLTDVEDGCLFFAIDIKEAINKYLDDKRDEVVEDTIEARGLEAKKNETPDEPFSIIAAHNARLRKVVPNCLKIYILT